MTNWPFLRRLFWTVLTVGLAADWASKTLVNVSLQPVRWPLHPIANAPGNVFPYPPLPVSIAHIEHWFDRWPGLETWGGGSLLIETARLVDMATRLNIGQVLVFLLYSLGVAFWVAFLAWRAPALHTRLGAGLALWLVGLVGNQGEILLFGHATDWIWISFWRFDFATNLADVASVTAEMLIVVTLVTEMVPRVARRHASRPRQISGEP